MYKPRILLSLLPPWGVEYPPIQLAYLADFFKKSGMDVKIMDFNIDMYNNSDEENRKLWETDKFLKWYSKKDSKKIISYFKGEIGKACEEIIKYNPDFACFSINNGNLRITYELLKKIRHNNSKLNIAVGGPGTTDADEMEQFNKLNIVIVRESGQDASISLYMKIKMKLGNIPKMATVPIFPDYSLFELEKYNITQLPFILSRGCVRKCVFCNDIVINKEYFHRSPKLVFDELCYYYKKYGIKNFESHDLLINGNLKLLEEFADLLIASGIDIEWHGQGIIREMDELLLKKLRKSGLKSFLFGLETASDKLLKNMNKLHTKKFAESVMRKTAKAGIKVYINLIVGFPNETEEDINETILFLLENKEYIEAVSSLNILTVIKGTKLYENKEKYGITKLKDDGYYSLSWEDKLGNDLKIRKKRLEKLTSEINKMGIPIHGTNSYWLD